MQYRREMQNQIVQLWDIEIRGLEWFAGRGRGFHRFDEKGKRQIQEWKGLPFSGPVGARRLS